MREDPGSIDSLDAVVLAGGRSRRFGNRDKALADLGGRPLVAHVVERVGSATGDVVVNCRREQVEAFETALDGVEVDVRFATDADPDRGPLYGMLTGLRAASRDAVAVVACDMPFVDPALLAALSERRTGHDAAVPVDDDGRSAPTQAVYGRERTIEAARSVLASSDSDGAIRDALDRLDVVAVPPEVVRAHACASTLLDVNTRERLRTAESLLEES